MEKKKNIAVLVIIILVALAGFYFFGGDQAGTCTIRCTSKTYNTSSTHGPYDYYTKAECEEKIEFTETILTDCSWEWEAY